MAVHGRYLVLYRDLPDEGTVRIERVLHGARKRVRFLWSEMDELISQPKFLATISTSMR